MTFKFLGIQVNLKKEIAVVSVIVIVILASLIGYLIIKNDNEIIIETRSKTSEAAESAVQASTVATAGAEAAKEVLAEEIKVYVVGCVNNQGIVTLIKGQLIDDAVRLAGGVTKDADLSGINMVYELKENVMLYIKSKKEIKQTLNTATSGGEAGKGVTIVKDSGGVVVGNNGQEAVSKGMVNINTALINELDTLPGVGEATAKEIISYREKNGHFKTIQDIMKVPRIKQSKFSSIKDFITVN